MESTPTQTVSAGSRHKKNLLIVLCLSGTYLIAEVIGGIITNSLALLADAAHMLTDVVGLLLAFIAIKIGERKADPSRTYGYYRTEILAAVVNAVVLLGISIYVLFEAYQRFQNPPEVQSKSMLIVAGIGLIVNIIGMMILRKDSEGSLNMKGAYFEVLSDMLTSVGSYDRRSNYADHRLVLCRPVDFSSNRTADLPKNMETFERSY
ncbi:UNVERIFIED_CONTAM: cation diffusion facilitator family transporter [Ralstonia mannitolilytica]